MLHYCANRSQLLLDERAEASSLTPKNASAAIITVGDKYLLQHRDPIPNIFYPDHWGLFGGALEEEESYDTALQRELKEELCIEIPIGELSLFTEMSFTLNFKEGMHFLRKFFHIEITEEKFSQSSLQEGADMKLFSKEELFDYPRLTPYDEFAIWLHISQNRIKH